MKLCACGCGRPVRNLYVQGHNPSGRSLLPRPLCACDCGMRVASPRDRWIHGHQARGEPVARVDADHLRHLLEGCASRAAFERDAGLAQGQTYRIIERGRCTYSVLDRTAVALGIHYAELVSA